MSTVEPFPVKKAFLYSLIASVMLSACLGILAILSGRFGWVEVRVVFTTVTIAVASICGLACSAYLGTKAGRALPLSGIALTCAASAMIVLGMWVEPKSEGYWKGAASMAVFAVACAHLSLLSMARLAEWFQWSLIAAYVVIFGVASMIAMMIFFEIDEIGMFQLLGVAAIVDAAVTILVPIFHRLSRSQLAPTSRSISASEVEAIDREIEVLKERIAALEKMKQSGA